ncbi:hypothetical protein FA13DRAFT_714129 [Coprinellus micaceus]|uniref:Uncharacterized protein n=1 Tax=Coprinellus micaceus TaxID=71717 RepID=A0A4Y7TVP5_COPMI|nr:hypothetical protein FA13DRAFT_714129 [Coprinellus micaceus]
MVAVRQLQRFKTLTSLALPLQVLFKPRARSGRPSWQSPISSSPYPTSQPQSYRGTPSPMPSHTPVQKPSSSLQSPNPNPKNSSSPGLPKPYYGISAPQVHIGQTPKMLIPSPPSPNPPSPRDVIIAPKTSATQQQRHGGPANIDTSTGSATAPPSPTHVYYVVPQYYHYWPVYLPVASQQVVVLPKTKKRSKRSKGGWYH